MEATSIFEPRSEPDPPVPVAAQQGQERNYVVPADTTWSQILDAVSAGGMPFDLTQGYAVNRASAITYSTFNRCITLIAGALAHIITQNHHLRIVDQNSKTVKTRRANRILEVLMHSPDGGVTSGVSFLEDVVTDYLTDGNGLLVPSMSLDGMLQGFRRMTPYGSNLMFSENGKPVYRATSADGPSSTVEYIAASDMIHVRWPHLLHQGRSRTSRRGFAVSPILALRPTLSIGLAADRWVKDYFSTDQGAIKSRMAISYEEFLTPEQRTQVMEAVSEYIASRMPLVLPGAAKVTHISESPQDAETEKLREFQVRDVSRVYGVPPPLLGESITQWGQGLLQLTRLFYSHCVVHHLNRVLGALKARLLQPNQAFTVDATAFLGADEEGLARLITSLSGDAQRAPVATREEMRRMVGLPRDPMGEFVEPTPTNNGTTPPGDDGNNQD